MRPELAGIASIDARGGLSLTADFLPEHLQKPEILEPRLRRAGAVDPTDPAEEVRAELASMDPHRGRMTFTVSPKELRRLFKRR